MSRSFPGRFRDSCFSRPIRSSSVFCEVGIKSSSIAVFGIAVFAVFLLGVSSAKGADKPIRYSVLARCAAFSPDAKRVVVGFGHPLIVKQDTPGWDIQLFDVETGKHIRTFGRHTGDILFVQFFPDGKKFLSTGMDNRIRIWDVAKGEQIASFPGTHIREAAILPDGKRLLYVSDNRLRMMDLVEGKVLKDYKDEVPTPIISLTASPDGKLAILGHWPERFGFADPTRVRLWDVEREKVIKAFDPKNDGFLAPVAFSEDSKYALSTRWDSSTKKFYPVLWEVSACREIKVLPALDSSPLSPLSYHISPEAKSIVAASKLGALARWNMDTGEDIWSVKEKMPRLWAFFVFSRNGQLGLSGCGGDKLQVTFLDLVLWDMANGRRLRSLQPKLEEPRRPTPLKEP